MSTCNLANGKLLSTSMTYLEIKRHIRIKMPAVKDAIMPTIASALGKCLSCKGDAHIFNVAACHTSEIHGAQCLALCKQCRCGTTVQHMEKRALKGLLMEVSD